MFDVKKYERVKKFFTGYLTHTKGKHAGKPFKLLNWQDDILKQIYGNVDENGKRIVKTCYIQIPKKNGKSEFAAGLALYHLLADGEIGGEVYSAAVDRNQASIVFNVAAQMVRANRTLRKRLQIRDSTKRIRYLKTSSVYKVLSSDSKSKHGLNISAAIIDELHAFPNRELFDVLTQGASDAREQPITIIITTAGNNKYSVCYEVYKYAKKVKNETVKDSSFLSVIYEPDNDDDWESEKTWKKVNPSIGQTISIDGLRSAYNKAKEIPSMLSSFQQLRLNMWVSNKEHIWIDQKHWLKNKDSEYPNLLGKKCYAGLDLASTIDIAAFVAVFFEDDRYFVKSMFWIPSENLIERVKRDKVPYDVWLRDGWIKTTEGNIIDYDVIKRDILEFTKDYQVEQINFDRWNAHSISQNLSDARLSVVGFGQGFASLSSPTKDLTNLTMQGKIVNENPVLNWMSGNMVLKQDAAGNVKPDKQKSAEKIDGMVALVMALDASVRHSGKRSSVYDNRGVIQL